MTTPPVDVATAVLAPRMLTEFRRKVRQEADELRAYHSESHDPELRRVLWATAERLDEIIGGAPV